MKRFIPETEWDKRQVYKDAFGVEFDCPERKQPPLPIDLAVLVAMRVLESNGVEFIQP